jgi:repressor LexA
MIDALINDGDIVVMEAASTAENGEMVAAWIRDREETTLKRFYHERDQVRLQPANPTMDPIYVAPDNVEIQGKVVAVIRSLAA